MKAVSLLATLLSSSAIVIIIIFISVKGISPFLGDYFYGQQDIISFLTGMMWRRDQGIYGVSFTVINTLVLVFNALVISLPLSVLTALSTAKTVPKHVTEVMTTVVELPASVPSVIYSVLASGTIAVLVNSLASSLGFVTARGSSLLTVILLLAIMIPPTITPLSTTAIYFVDKEVELGSLALSVTWTQTNFKVILTSVKPGIFVEAMLGIGRAFGETTAVTMVAGNRMLGSTVNVFDTIRTLATTMLADLKETIKLDYDIRFSIGLVLMVVTLLSNLLLNLMKKEVGNMK